MNVGGMILLFIGVVLIFAGFRSTWKNWYSTFTSKSTNTDSSSSTNSSSNVGSIV